MDIRKYNCECLSVVDLSLCRYICFCLDFPIKDSAISSTIASVKKICKNLGFKIGKGEEQNSLILYTKQAKFTVIIELNKDKNDRIMLISIRIDNGKIKSLSDIIIAEKFIANVLTLLNKNGIKTGKIKSCIGIDFDVTKYKIISGLSLPADITISDKINRQIGKTSIDGFHIRFKDSPIGLVYLSISVSPDEKKIGIIINTIYLLKPDKNVFKNSIFNIDKVLDLFMVKL